MLIPSTPSLSSVLNTFDPDVFPRVSTKVLHCLVIESIWLGLLQILSKLAGGRLPGVHDVLKELIKWIPKENVGIS